MSVLFFRVNNKTRYFVLIIMPYIEAPAFEIFRILDYHNDVRNPNELHVLCCFVIRYAVKF